MNQYRLLLVLFVIPMGFSNLVADYGLKPRITADQMMVKGSTREEPSHVLLTRKDTCVTFKGYLDEQYFKGKSLLTLNGSNPDDYHYFRHRSDLIFHATHGKETYGSEVMEGLIDIAANFNWRFEDLYTRVDPFSVFLDGSGPQGFWVQDSHQHSHTTRVPLFFMQEAWLKANFDALVPQLFKGKSYFLQAGYFPFKVGRGISLGESAEGGIAYMGFNKASASYTGGLVTSAPQATQLPPAFLLHGTIVDGLAWEVYFSKWIQRNSFPWTIDEALHSPIIDPRKAIGFGKGKDSDQWATRLLITATPQETDKLYIEPYHVYLSSGQHSVEYLADSELYLNTGGLMVDYETGPLKVNVEVAGQWGKQYMHALDRNFFKYRRSSTGGVETRATHILRMNGPDSDGQGEPFYNSTGYQSILGALADDNVVNHNLSNFKYRSADQNGTQLFDADGNAITQTTPSGSYTNATHTTAAASTSKVFHAPDWWLGEEAGEGGARFRAPYKLKLGGWMGLCDVSYTFNEFPLMLAGAVGYISGDAYPYETEVNKDYKGFLPLRDTLYQGKAVESLAIFGLRLLPRPLNVSYRKLFAYNNIDDISNLSYFGFSCNWYPLKQKEKMRVNGNVIVFGQNASLYTWDPNGTHSESMYEEQLKSQQQKVHFRSLTNADALGWTSNTRTSNFLGTEWNIQLFYNITPSCQINLKTMVFMPGTLYKDLLGQPNQVTRMLLDTDQVWFNSLGNDTAWFLALGMKYNF